MMKYAMFPLNLFVLPGEQTYLHIFEPRYKELLQDVLDTNMSFGVYYQAEHNTASYGTMVRLNEVVKSYPGGEADIQIEGEHLFRLDAFFQEMEDKSYPGGMVSRITRSNPELDQDTLANLASFMKMRSPNKFEEIPLSTWEAAVELQLNSHDKYELARQDMAENRMAYLRSHILLQKAILEQEANTKFNVYLN